MATYDLVVVGAGPGGYVAALRAAQLGLRTAVVEADRLGGVCGNWGCIPSKALLHDAEVVADVRTARKSGLLVGEVTADFGKAVDRSRGVADQQGKGVAFLFKKHGVDYRQGRGRLVRGGVAVSANGGAPERVDARHVLVATGSGERLLPGMQVDGRVVQTSREALADRTLPASLVVLGGGAVGVELA